MKKDNSAKSLPVKASKYPTKRTVNLAQRESHSRSTLTLTLGLVLIVVLSFCVANFGVLRQLDRQRAAENAYNTVHSQYTQMQQALADYDDVELQYRTYSRTWMQEEGSPFYIPVDRLEVLDLLEGYLMPYGTVKTVLVEDDVAIITMSGMDLEQISAMFQRVQQQPIVKSASLTIAATPRLSRTDLLDFSVTITLQPADKEAAALDLFLPEAIRWCW